MLTADVADAHPKLTNAEIRERMSGTMSVLGLSRTSWRQSDVTDGAADMKSFAYQRASSAFAPSWPRRRSPGPSSSPAAPICSI